MRKFRSGGKLLAIVWLSTRIWLFRLVRLYLYFQLSLTLFLCDCVCLHVIA